MDIKLVNLSCRNFMGFPEFQHNFNRKSTDIFGANGSGKTTLKSLFNWVLFGKNADGDNDTNFSIRPLKNDGSMVRNVDIEGIVTLEIDGRVVEFKRVQIENWTKKRGSIDQEFTGNSTEYYIDGTPKKKSDYDKFISNLVDSEVFKLITDVEYFGSLHWKKQRDIINNLLAIDEEEILKSDPKFDVLLNYNKPVDEIVAQIRAEQSKVNKDLEFAPVKIDERSKDINKGTSREENVKVIEKLEKEKKLLNAELEKLNKAKYQAQNNEIVAKEEKLLASLNSQLIELENKKPRDALPIYVLMQILKRMHFQLLTKKRQKS